MERPAKRVKVDISGDALEDDFELDQNLVASDSEAEAVAVKDDDDDDEQSKNVNEDDAEFFSASKQAPAKPVTKEDKKRKERKQQKQQDKKEKTKLRAEMDSTLGTMPTDLLADRLAEKQRRALPKMTELELADIELSSSMLYDSSHVSDRTSLAAFIKQALPALPATLAKPLKAQGSPRVLVLSGAALRVADLCRDVREWKTKEADVAKLFAKHFKLQEHVDYLKKTKVAIAVGTPGRIAQLLAHDDEPLSITYLSYILLDVSTLDSKKRSLLDLNDSREDLFKRVLGHPKVMERLRQDKAKIIIF